MKAAFLGLGVMGYPMAGHLQKGGIAMTVYNRTSVKAENWQKEYEGNIARTPREAAAAADFMFLCVGNDDDVRAIFYGEDGILAGAASGTIIIDHSTTSTQLARELHEACSAQQIGFLDAPVSGGEVGAQKGILTIMVGGNEDDFARSEPLMQHYAKKMTLMGAQGSGQLAKMVNQICIAGLVQALSEGLDFALRENLDCEKLLTTLSGGAAQSWQMDNRGMTMVQDVFDFGFALDWMIKDLGYCLAQGEKNGAQLEVTKRVHAFYRELSEQGYGKMDTSALIKRLR